MITVLPAPLSERDEWMRFAAQNLAAAYGDDEPEYTLADVKVRNPNYDERHGKFEDVPPQPQQ